MKRSTISLIFSTAVVSAALIIAALSDNPWASVAPGALFVFVAFPRWRSKMYRLADRLIGKLTKNDRCDPR